MSNFDLFLPFFFSFFFNSIKKLLMILQAFSEVWQDVFTYIDFYCMFWYDNCYSYISMPRSRRPPHGYRPRPPWHHVTHRPDAASLRTPAVLPRPKPPSAGSAGARYTRTDGGPAGCHCITLMVFIWKNILTLTVSTSTDSEVIDTTVPHTLRILRLEDMSSQRFSRRSQNIMTATLLKSFDRITEQKKNN